MPKRNHAGMSPEEKAKYEKYLELRKEFNKPPEKKYINADHEHFANLVEDAAQFVKATEGELQKVAQKYGKTIRARVALTGRNGLIQEFRNNRA